MSCIHTGLYKARLYKVNIPVRELIVQSIYHNARLKNVVTIVLAEGTLYLTIYLFMVRSIEAVRGSIQN